MDKLDHNKFVIRALRAGPLSKVTFSIMDGNQQKLFHAVQTIFFFNRYAFFDDENSKTPLFTVAPENGFWGGGVVNLVKGQNGALIGKVGRIPKIFNPTQQIEDSAGNVVAEIKIVNMPIVTKYNFYLGESIIGYWQLESLGSVDYILDLWGDPKHKLDRRLALAMAFLLRSENRDNNWSTMLV